MKKILYSLAAAVLALAACSQEKIDAPVFEKVQDPLVLKAHYGKPSTKSAVSDAGKFSWTEDDAIAVWTTTSAGSSFQTFAIQSGAGTPDAEFFGADVTAEVSDVAVLPAALNPSLNGKELTVTLPYILEYAETVTGSPMIAQVDNGAETDLAFKHIAGLVKVTVDNIPSWASVFYFATPGKKINGDFTISDYSSPSAAIETAEDLTEEEDYVAIEFTPTGDKMTFYIPLPVGSYDGFYAAFYDENFALASQPYFFENAFSVERADLLLAPEIVAWHEAEDILVSYDGPYNHEGTYYSSFSLLTAGPQYKFAIFSYDSETISALDAMPYIEYVAGSTEYEIRSGNNYPLYNLSPGYYLAVMVAFDDEGNCLNTYSYTVAKVEEVPEESSDAYKKWIGTWSISGIDFYEYLGSDTETNIRFDGVTVSEDVPDNSFTIAHWESNTTPASSFDWDNTFTGYQPTFTAKFDSESGKLQFVAETITSFTSGGTTYYLTFNDYWPYNDGVVLAEATLSADGQSAEIAPLNDCYTLGYYIMKTDGSIMNWGYSFYINTDTPVPMTMTKTSSSVPSSVARKPDLDLRANPAAWVPGKERNAMAQFSVNTRKSLPSSLKKK